jgi:hypothetical protein
MITNFKPRRARLFLNSSLVLLRAIIKKCGNRK